MNSKDVHSLEVVLATKNKLVDLGKKNDTYDDIINKLLSGKKGKR